MILPRQYLSERKKFVEQKVGSPKREKSDEVGEVLVDTHPLHEHSDDSELHKVGYAVGGKKHQRLAPHASFRGAEHPNAVPIEVVDKRQHVCHNVGYIEIDAEQMHQQPADCHYYQKIGGAHNGKPYYFSITFSHIVVTAALRRNLRI